MTVDCPLVGFEPAAVGARSIRLHHVECSTGGEAVTAPLTWAQQHMLMLFQALDPQTQSLNLSVRLVLRDGLTLDGVIEALRDLMVSHEALRTRYVRPPLGPAQRVLSEVALPVAVVDCGEQVPDETLPAVLAALTGEPFDIENGSPIRAAVLVADGSPRYIAFALSHLTNDMTGWLWLKYHLRALRPDVPDDPRFPQAPYLMRDAAEWESSPAGLRLGTRAVAQHAATYRAMPQTMLPRQVQEVRSPRFRYLEFTSPMLAMAVPYLAARHNTTPAAVLYAAVCSVAGFVSALPGAFIQLTVGNRLEPKLYGAVGMYTQDVPAWVDLTDASVADVIDRAAPAILQAARFGMYPPIDLEAARKRTELDRGIAFDLSCWLNVVPVARISSSEERPSASDLARARTQAHWRWVEGTDNSTSTYFVFANGAGDTLVLTLIVDTAVLPPDEALAWVRAVERVLGDSVSQEVAAARIGEHAELSRVSRDGDWTLADGNWIRRSDVAGLVLGASGSAVVDVFAVPSPQGPRLTAFVDGGRCVPDLARLHEDCVAALPGNRTAMAAQEYVVCSGVPRTRDMAGWQLMPVLAQGTGRVAESS